MKSKWWQQGFPSWFLIAILTESAGSQITSGISMDMTSESPLAFVYKASLTGIADVLCG